MILPKDKKKAEITVNRIIDGQNRKEKYAGISVRELREDWSGIIQVEFVGRDGMAVAVSAEEILSSSRLILAEDPQGNNLRLIAGDDSHGRRWCKDIEAIKFVEEEE
ncbi:MAG: hypothetical protein ACOX8H_06200 [Ruminococcus sp.]